MKPSLVLRFVKLLPALLLATSILKAQYFFPTPPPNEAMFEFVGQVKNAPPAGPGLPATSNQYGYLSHIQGLTDDQIYLPGGPKNEATAVFTFYHDSITDTVTDHGSLKIVIREGTTTIYYNPGAGGDLTTPKPDSFRQGTPVLTSRWRHQVIFDANPSPDPAAPPRTSLFFVTWWHTITSAQVIDLGDRRRCCSDSKELDSNNTWSGESILPARSTGSLPATRNRFCRSSFEINGRGHTTRPPGPVAAVHRRPVCFESNMKVIRAERHWKFSTSMRSAPERSR
jgi:hypothetical protein